MKIRIIKKLPKAQKGLNKSSYTPNEVDSILYANKNKNFVNRYINPSIFPIIQNPDGGYSSELMQSSDNFAYPTIIQDPKTGTLTNFNNIPYRQKAAYDYAMKNNEAIRFPNEQLAEWFANNGYKSGIKTYTKHKQGGGLTKAQTVETPPNFKPGKEYAKGWYTSPMYKNIIEKQATTLYPDNPKKVQKYANLFLENPTNNYLPPSLLKGLTKKQEAYGINYGENLQIDKDFALNNPQLVNSLYAHELFHDNAQTNYDFDYITKQTPKFNSAIHPKGILGKASSGDRYAGLTHPEEVRSEIHAIRELGKEHGIYDPFTQPFTKDYLEKVNTIYNSGDFDGKNYNQLQRLKDYYSDDQIIDMMNTISQNNNQPTTNTQMARRGGWIDSYEDGSTVGGGGLIKAQTGKEKLPDGTSWFNQQVVQDANARMNATSTNSLGRVISTPESRFKERRGNYLVENPQKFTNADYLAGHKEEGLDNSVLSDPLAMAAALTAGGVGLGTYGLSQVPRMFLGNLASEATAGLTDVGKHLTRNTALRNTYKLNPWRFKPNPESFYRQIGNEGLTDALSSNTIRSANQSTFPRPHFVEGTDFTKLYSTGEGATGSRPSVIFETSGINQAGEPFVFPANSTSGYTPWIAGDATVPLSEGRILQKDWLRGYKEVDVSKQLPGSPNAFKDPINLDLFGFGRKKLTPLEKQTLLTQQELSRANKDALTFSQSAANKAKLQEFRPNQDFSVSNQQPITDYVSGSYTPDYIDLRRPINGHAPGTSEWNRLNNSLQTWRTVDNTLQTAPKPKISINKSGLTKEEAIEKASSKDKDIVSKMSETEFENTVLKPNGEVVPYQAGKKAEGVIDATHKEYIDVFNSYLDDLNENIINHPEKGLNTSGIRYEVKGIDEAGRITVYTPKQTLADGTVIEAGEQTVTMPIRKAGFWRGEIEDVASHDYINSVPGLTAYNTSGGIFPKASNLKGTPGTRFYESLNKYMKKYDLGRISDGASGQSRTKIHPITGKTQTGSYEVWEGNIKKGKAIGFYSSPRQVSGIYRSLFPYVGAGYLGYEGLKGALQQKKQGGGLTKAQTGKEKLPDGYVSYASSPEYFNNRAVYSDNADYNELIKKSIYAGTHAFNPQTGQLIKLQTQVRVPKDTQQMATRDYTEGVRRDPTDPNYVGADKRTKQLIQNSTNEAYQNPLMYAPGMIGMAGLPETFGMGYGFSQAALTAGLSALPFIPHAYKPKWIPPTDDLVAYNEMGDEILRYEPSDFQNFNTREQYELAKKDMQDQLNKYSKRELQNFKPKSYGTKLATGVYEGKIPLTRYPSERTLHNMNGGYSPIADFNKAVQDYKTQLQFGIPKSENSIVASSPDLSNFSAITRENLANEAMLQQRLDNTSPLKGELERTINYNNKDYTTYPRKESYKLFMQDKTPFTGKDAWKIGLNPNKEGGQSHNNMENNKLLNLIAASNHRRNPIFQTGGALDSMVVSDLWKKLTGTSWAEAKKRGLTDGSYDQNIKLRNMLMQEAAKSKPDLSRFTSTYSGGPRQVPGSHANMGSQPGMGNLIKKAAQQAIQESINTPRVKQPWESIDLRQVANEAGNAPAVSNRAQMPSMIQPEIVGLAPKKAKASAPLTTSPNPQVVSDDPSVLNQVEDYFNSQGVRIKDAASQMYNNYFNRKEEHLTPLQESMRRADQGMGSSPMLTALLNPLPTVAKSYLKSWAGAPITQDDFTDPQLDALAQAIASGQLRGSKPSRSGYIGSFGYDDYPGKRKALNAIYNIAESDGRLEKRLEDIVKNWSSVNAQTTIGMGDFAKTPNGDYIITDDYNFDKKTGKNHPLERLEDSSIDHSLATRSDVIIPKERVDFYTKQLTKKRDGGQKSNKIRIRKNGN